MRTYDLIVIGTGTAAQVADGCAARAERLMFAYPTGASDIGSML